MGPAPSSHARMPLTRRPRQRRMRCVTQSITSVGIAVTKTVISQAGTAHPDFRSHLLDRPSSNLARHPPDRGWQARSLATVRLRAPAFAHRLRPRPPARASRPVLRQRSGSQRRPGCASSSGASAVPTPTPAPARIQQRCRSPAARRRMNRRLQRNCSRFHPFHLLRALPDPGCYARAPTLSLVIVSAVRMVDGGQASGDGLVRIGMADRF